MSRDRMGERVTLDDAPSWCCTMLPFFALAKTDLDEVSKPRREQKAPPRRQQKKLCLQDGRALNAGRRAVLVLHDAALFALAKPTSMK